MATKLKIDKCTCCGSNAISMVMACKDYTVTQQVFEVWKCTNCSFRFTQDIPGELDIAPYYHSDAYVSHSNTKTGLINRLYHQVRSITLGTKKNLVKKVTGISQGKLLDVGAGTGAFAAEMHKSGWKVTALEPDTDARATALAQNQVQLEPLQDLRDLTPATFDAITLWHVLEHVHDLHGYLHTFSRLLKNNGKLLVAVPNHTSHDAEVYGEYWAAYDVPRHLYHFSPKSMVILLEQHQLKLEAIKPMWFDSFYVSMLSDQYKFGKTNYLRAFWVGLVSNIKAVSDRKKCSSLIYIISKSPASIQL